MFGFSNKALEFPTLEELVLHYSMNELTKHNKDLNITLKFPVGVPP